jgi:hypothetical protein
LKKPINRNSAGTMLIDRTVSTGSSGMRITSIPARRTTAEMIGNTPFISIVCMAKLSAVMRNMMSPTC